MSNTQQTIKSAAVIRVFLFISIILLQGITAAFTQAKMLPLGGNINDAVVSVSNSSSVSCHGAITDAQPLQDVTEAKSHCPVDSLCCVLLLTPLAASLLWLNRAAPISLASVDSIGKPNSLIHLLLRPPQFIA